MKAYRFKKYRRKNVKVNVIVISDDDKRAIIRPGGKLDAPVLAMLPKPVLPRKLFTRVNRPSFKGRVEFTFDGKL